MAAKSILIANWKMNPSSWREAKKLFDATKRAAEHAPRVSVIVAPPSLFVRELTSSYRGRRVLFAAQNMFFEPSGSYTGELSAAQLRDAKVSAVLVGHAERRALGETNSDTRKKVAAALAAGLTPVLCIGEHERLPDGSHLARVRTQLLEGFGDVPETKVQKVLVAYEPVWAIGAPKPMDARGMHEMAIFIRKNLVERFGEIAMKTNILYGGAIDEHNARAMRDEGDVDGLLVGRASIDPDAIAVLIAALN